MYVEDPPVTGNFPKNAKIHTRFDIQLEYSHQELEYTKQELQPWLKQQYVTKANQHPGFNETLELAFKLAKLELEQPQVTALIKQVEDTQQRLQNISHSDKQAIQQKYAERWLPCGNRDWLNLTFCAFHAIETKFPQEEDSLSIGNTITFAESPIELEPIRDDRTLMSKIASLLRDSFIEHQGKVASLHLDQEYQGLSGHISYSSTKKIETRIARQIASLCTLPVTERTDIEQAYNSKSTARRTTQERAIYAFDTWNNTKNTETNALIANTCSILATLLNITWSHITPGSLGLQQMSRELSNTPHTAATLDALNTIATNRLAAGNQRSRRTVRLYQQLKAKLDSFEDKNWREKQASLQSTIDHCAQIIEAEQALIDTTLETMQQQLHGRESFSQFALEFEKDGEYKSTLSQGNPSYRLLYTDNHQDKQFLAHFYLQKQAARNNSGNEADWVKEAIQSRITQTSTMTCAALRALKALLANAWFNLSINCSGISLNGKGQIIEAIKQLENGSEDLPNTLRHIAQIAENRLNIPQKRRSPQTAELYRLLQAQLQHFENKAESEKQTAIQTLLRHCITEVAKLPKCDLVMEKALEPSTSPKQQSSLLCKAYPEANHDARGFKSLNLLSQSNLPKAVKCKLIQAFAGAREAPISSCMSTLFFRSTATNNAYHSIASSVITQP